MPQIFNRQGTCLYYQEFQPSATSAPAGDIKSHHKLMYGFLFSLKQLVGKLSPRK